METIQTSEHKSKSQIVLVAATGMAFIWLIITTWVYYFEPLTGQYADYLNDQLFSILVLGAALAAAVLGTRLLTHFGKSEPPFLVWLMFALGWWMWAGGEASGIAMNYCCYYAEWPDITVLDIFYTVGYLFFMLALFFQFRLIYGQERKIGLLYYFFIVILALLVTLGITQLAIRAGLGENRSWLSMYQALFYPVGDLTIGLAALWLSLLFGRASWGRPWWGLIGFALADGINIFLWIGGDGLLIGQFANGEGIVTMIDLLSVIVYTASYLIVAIAFLANHELLKFGPAFHKRRVPPSKFISPPDRNAED